MHCICSPGHLLVTLGGLGTQHTTSSMDCKAQPPCDGGRSFRPRLSHQQPYCRAPLQRQALKLMCHTGSGIRLLHCLDAPSPWPSQQAACSQRHHVIAAKRSTSTVAAATATTTAPAPSTASQASVGAAAAAFLLDPQVAFLSQVLTQGVLLPIFGGWLVVTTLSASASRARKWCDDNPDEPLSMELLGLLPAALESPTRLAVALFVTTRVLRNIAAGLNDFIHAFTPQWDDWADAIAHFVTSWLGPFDQTLLRLYTVVAVLAAARVVTRWKTITLEFILHQRAGLTTQTPTAATRTSSSSKGKSKSGRSSGGGSGGGGGSSSSSKAQAAAPLLAASVDAAAGDDFDEVGVVKREGSMLSVSMRPRSTSTAETAGDLAGGSAAGAAAAPAAVASAGGWSGSSSSSSKKAELVFSGQPAGEDDAVGRLLLPLDSILSWAIAVMAGLFAVQLLGINIQPLLAVGGASSLLIGLATQTLLTNAVMGVSIFLARPFVPGDSITVQAAGHILVSGVVEKITPMRTLLRTDDDVLVTLPNKTIVDMIVYNKSARREVRNRPAARSWERPFLKFKVKLPQKELQHLQELQKELKQCLKRPGVAQQSVEVALTKFADAGAEVLVQCLLLVAVGSPTGQQLLLDMAFTVRKHGGTLVSIL